MKRQTNGKESHPESVSNLSAICIRTQKNPIYHETMNLLLLPVKTGACATNTNAHMETTFLLTYYKHNMKWRYCQIKVVAKR